VVIAMDKADIEYIREKVQDAVAWSMASFTILDLIDTVDKLTEEEKEWARKHLDWQVYVIDKENE
jgi:hypothetical protein